MPDFFLQTLSFNIGTFQTRFPEMPACDQFFGFCVLLWVFFIIIILSLIFFKKKFFFFGCCPEYLKDQVNFNAFQSPSHHDGHTCIFVQAGNEWNIASFIGTTANNQSWNKTRIFWKDHFVQQFLFKIA